MMSQDVYCIAPNEDLAQQVVEQMKQSAVLVRTFLIGVTSNRSRT
jgi:hypothetical protein